MNKRKPIRRGALGRGFTMSLAGARASGIFAVDAALTRLRGADAGRDALVAREAQRFARQLGELKGTYVKIGQIFALLGEHFLPRPLTDALHGLEAQTAPIDWLHVEPLLEAALDDRLSELDVEPQPLAAASLAQVHRARILSTGREIVLKLQYPALRQLIDDDFDAVVRMLKLARWLPAGREFDGWLAEMRAQLHDEVDYPRELDAARQMAGRVRAITPRRGEVPLLVPDYHAEYSGADVLAIDYVSGMSVTDERVRGLAQDRRNDLGRTMLALFFKEVFDWGLMQTDPNFGNYLVMPEGQGLALLDFGSVRELSADFREGLRQVIVSGHRGDAAGICSGLEMLRCLRPDSSRFARETFAAFVDHLLEPLAPPERLPSDLLNADGEYQWQRSALMQRAGRKAAGSAATSHFDTPSGNFAVIARKLTGVFTFISVLGAEFNGYDVLLPYLEGGVDVQ